MRAVKHSPNIFQRNPHSRAIAFRDFSAQSDKHSFNISPGDIGSLRLLENGFQGFAVFAIHDAIISESDTVIKMLLAMLCKEITQRFLQADSGARLGLPV